MLACRETACSLFTAPKGFVGAPAMTDDARRVVCFQRTWASLADCMQVSVSVSSYTCWSTWDNFERVGASVRRSASSQ